MEFVHRTAVEIHDAYPWTDAAAIEVTLAVHAASTALLNAGREVSSALGLGRTVGRYSVLRALSLAPKGRLSHKEIANRLLVGRAAVTDLVDGLERAGMVTRTRSEEDRRSFLVSLTPTGEAVAARYVPAVARLAERFCAGLDAEQRRTLTELLLEFCRAAPEDPLDILEQP